MQRLAPFFFLLACSGKAAEDTSSAADDTSEVTDTNTDTDTDTEPACATLNSGDDWAWTGECPQMRTPCDIVVTGCSLTIDYAADGGMTMGMPYAATIDGDTITFEDGDSVPGCVGTVVSADEVTGSCEDGCTFTLKR
jgi:hypothetical protein